MYRLKQQIINISVPDSKNKRKFTLKNNINNSIIMEKIVDPDEFAISIDLTTLEKHYNYDYYFEEYSQNAWTKFYSPKSIFPIFQDTSNNLEFSYHEFKNTDKLLVIFSSSVFNGRFNYTNTLKEVNQSKLFISDENYLNKDSTGSYYMGSMKQLDYESKIIKLIENIRILNNLQKKDIILIGSSKGGFAALYYGFKYNYGYCIVGSPTIYLGKIHKHSLKGKRIITHLTGDTTEKSITWLNNIITNEVKNNSSLSIYYHVGKDEPRYTRHAIPFIKLLSDFNITLSSLDLGDYSNHSLVAEYYPRFLISSIKKIIK